MVKFALLIASFATFLMKINNFFLQQGDDEFHGYNPICILLSIIGFPILGLTFLISLFLSLIINVMIWMLSVYVAILTAMSDKS